MSTLHYPMPGISTSLCRPALTVLCHHFGVPSSSLRHLGTGLGAGTLSRRKLGPCITEHINQLSRFHAQRLSVLNFVRFDQALYFFGKKLFVKNFLVKTLFVTHKFKYPVYLGAPLMELFLLHMIILIRLRSLFMYYATICTILT